MPRPTASNEPRFATPPDGVGGKAFVVAALPRVIRWTIIAALATACMAAWLIAAAETLTGRVVRIQDGDTLTVLIAHHQVRVRLADIDAPEPHQPFYAQSRQSLAALCFKNEAQLEVRGRDRNKRPVAYVACGGVDANAEQVRKGLAWVEPRFAPKGSRLYALHDEAKAAGRGLWADPHPIPPWEWRRKQREQVR